VVNEDVVHGKPAPDVFLLAASRLGIPPSECLALEDSVTGARAGLSAGMSVVLVPVLADPPAEYIGHLLLVAASLDEAAPHVLRAVRAA
jgi:beta-phosphoglucomutase-like phosphatase (HAD superfamily)